MVSWSTFAEAAPELASRAHAMFTAHKHHTMATLRKDGAPRVSGTEVEFQDGELRVGMMPGTRRAADLRRDARIGLHSQNADPPPGNDAGWAGEAKIHGRAVEVDTDKDGPDYFRIDIDEVILTSLGQPADHLLIESWDPKRGVVHRRR